MASMHFCKKFSKDCCMSRGRCIDKENGIGQIGRHKERERETEREREKGKVHRWTDKMHEAKNERMEKDSDRWKGQRAVGS